MRELATRRSFQVGGLVALVVAVALVLVSLPGSDAPTRLEAIEDTATSSSVLDEVTGATTTTSTTGPPPTTSTSVASSVPVTGGCAAIDRNRILFHRTYQDPPRWHVFAVNEDGTCLRQLTFADGHQLNWGASWSPDGTRIAFIRKDTGVMIANADGTNERLLLPETKVQPSAAHTEWSPDGTKLAVGRQEGVWVVTVSTGVARHVGPGDNIHPSWSPDGKQLVYGAFSDGPSVVIVNADGSGRRTLVDEAYFPSWSSKNLIVLQHRNKLVTMRPDGSGEKVIADADAVGMPNWNRSGTKIVVSDGPGSIFVMNADGSDFHRVPLDPGVTADNW